MQRNRCICGLLAIVIAIMQVQGATIQIAHFNDNHGRFESQDSTFNVCNNNTVCFGGYAKQQTVVNKLRANAAAAKQDFLLLHAGDLFTGTTWDYVYTKSGNVIAPYFLKQLGLDVFVLGNHEFDYGPIVAGYLVGNLTAMNITTVSCNTDVSKEPALKDVKPFIVKTLPISNITVGLIGLTTQGTNVTSSPGPTVTFNDPAAVVGQCIKDAKAAGAQMIIAVTHIGYDEDVALAQLSQAQGIDLIVGGHSHTLLYTGNVPALLKSPATNETDPVLGGYPTMVTNGQKKIPVTQALWASRYMGNFSVEFVPSSGLTFNPSDPILLGDVNSTNPVADDPAISANITALKPPLIALSNTVAGSTDVFLDGERGDVRNAETNLGDLVADAEVWFIKTQTKFLTEYPGVPLVGHMNGGGIRTSIAKGTVTRGQVITVLPFGNTLVVKMLNSSSLLAALNNGVSQWTGDGNAAGRFPQVSNIKFSFDSNATALNRVKKVQILVGSAYVDLTAYNGNILFVTNNYVAAGGDGYTSVNNSPLLFDSSVPLDEVVDNYISTYSPVSATIDGRIANCAPGYNTTAALCVASAPAAAPAASSASQMFSPLAATIALAVMLLLNLIL